MILSRKFYLRLIVLLLCVASGNDATAQFWKKEKPRRKVYNKYPPKPVAEVKKEEKKKKKRDIDYPASTKKERYRIDVMIPLYLDELVKGGKPTPRSKWPDKAESGINFYEGIKLAIDTLATMGYTTDIYVHDISSTESGVENMIKSDSLANTDLIIGFVSAQHVDDLAKYAKSKHVNFISAFSPSDANVRDNPYFILMNPTLQTNCEEISKAAVKKRNKESLVLYKRMNNVTDSAAYSYIIEDSKVKNLSEIDCDKLPDSATLAAAFDSMITNIVIIPVIDVAYAEKLINQLDKYFPNYRFNIFGMPSWKNIVSTKKMIDFGDHIAINITQPYYFDQTVSFGMEIANKYRANFGGKPSELTFRGFELVYWMTDLLNKYGAVFNEKTSDNGMAIFTKFEFKPQWDTENNLFYIENKHLYLYHYQAGTVLVDQ